MDNDAASAVAGAANVAIEQPLHYGAGVDGGFDRSSLAGMVSAAFEGAANGATGQLALAAIVLSSEPFAKDVIAASVADASLAAAGLDEFAKQHAFESALRSYFPTAAPQEEKAAVDQAEDPGFSPSLKPQARN